MSAALLMTVMAGTACLTRPVGQQPPTTKVNFTSTVSQQAVDKVDLLFAIDNSSSMGDKQVILYQAIPDLLSGLLKPRCGTSDQNGVFTPNGALADPAGNKDNHYGCTAGSDPEFKPVSDMHIGIVSSSLGNFGGDVCDVNNARSNDRGHLLDINGTLQAGGAVTINQSVADAEPGKFLAWFPQSKDNIDDPKRHPSPAKPVITLKALSDDLGAMVLGVQQNGCGLEAQLESMYRFLIQPDPWDNIQLDGNHLADLGDGIDNDVIAQRANFLRPDSLVAIIMLTDEDDSSADPLAIGGQGWAFMSKEFPGSKVFRGNPKQGTTAPRGTSVCDTNPMSDDCTSCGFAALCDASQPSCQKIKSDPNCRTSGVSGQSGPGYDGYIPTNDDELNVRFQSTLMKRRFGIDPQYPISRYVDGLTNFRVPNRKTEHVTTKDASGNRQIASYTSTPTCTNPLFAASLPAGPVNLNDANSYCNLPRSTRSPDLVFFAVIGGVPNQLLYPKGYDPNNPENNRTTDAAWTTILGKDPVHYILDGIDPHMKQSIEARPELASGGDPGSPKGNNGTDPIQGRDWNTIKQDRQFACTFDLPTAPLNFQRVCNSNDESCDCSPTAPGNPPLCGGPNGTTQVKAKAYPTIREFEVAKALGDQGIAASLCPIQLTNQDAADYGYRPAVASIIDRLKNALTTQCLPQRLRPANACNVDADCAEGEKCGADKICASSGVTNVPCLVLAQLDPNDSCDHYGLKEPPADILQVFRDQQRAESGNIGGDGGLDLSKLPVCEIPQSPVAKGDTCVNSTQRVWCYVENDVAAGKRPARNCAQAILFSSGTTDIAGARFSLQCIQQFAAGVAAGDTKK